MQTNQKVAALTFNVSQDSKNVDSLLDSLQNTHATFFISAFWVKNNPVLARRIIKEGHEIGMLHNSSPGSVEKMKEEILETSQLINKIVGKPPALTRVSKEGCNDLFLITASDAGYPVVQWSIDIFNQKNNDKDSIVNDIHKNIHPGAIILLPCSAEVAKTLQTLTKKLTGDGYKLITVSEMVKPGPAGTE
jgi:peptidoglycan/xylan/chitin deacetylase (PgdA/CDA1 family)